MKFVFNEKSKIETDIITDILVSENIRYKIDELVPDLPISIIFFYNLPSKYNITIDVSLEKFDFIKKLVSDRVDTLLNLEKCYAIKNTMDNIDKQKSLKELEKDLNNCFRQVVGINAIRHSCLYTIPTSQTLSFTVKEVKKKRSLLKTIGLWLAKKGK